MELQSGQVYTDDYTEYVIVSVTGNDVVYRIGKNQFTINKKTNI